MAHISAHDRIALRRILNHCDTQAAPIHIVSDFLARKYPGEEIRVTGSVKPNNSGRYWLAMEYEGNKPADLRAVNRWLIEQFADVGKIVLIID